VAAVEGGRCHQLVINDVQLSDAGQYAAVAAAVDHANDSPDGLTTESSATLTIVISSAEGSLAMRLLCVGFFSKEKITAEIVRKSKSEKGFKIDDSQKITYAGVLRA
jgi:hypothetical protein